VILEEIAGPEDLRALGYADVERLCAEIREFLVEAVSRTGGHLGPNLGVVELSVAMHRVFDSPRDRIIFDTGHQAYVHKILTGRRERFDTLRQLGGLSGYPDRDESEHDLVENSHASTGLSYARSRPPAGCAARMARWCASSATARSPAAWPTRRSTTSATSSPRW
jgi:1-deoxy-D-xylulose-5-phosphate synthase